MRIGLVTDSPSDLPEDLLERYRIEVVPAILVLEGTPYIDGITITRTEFYTRQPTLRSSATTAAPASENFAASFRQLFSTGCEHVIGIFTAEKLTAIPSIARHAALEFPGNVTVLESGSLSMGTGYQVLSAAKAIESKFSLAEIIQAVKSTRERVRIYAALDTIEYLRRSGRVSQSVAALGGLLSIKPVVELNEGVVKPLGAPRTTPKANEKLFNLLDELGPLENLSILHTNAETRANKFLERLVSKNGNALPANVRIVNVTTVIGTHVGPNGLGLAAVVGKI